MLVAVAGSQGCGKSTIVSELEKRNYASVKRKTSRSILDEWGVTLQDVNNNNELTLKFQDEILKRKQEDDSSRVGSNEVVVTERSAADFFTYAMFALGKDNRNSDWIDAYYEKCKELQKIYDIIFFLKAGHFSPEKDGVRGINTHYSTAVDLLMLHWTKELTVSSKLIIIDTPNLNVRVNMIHNHIKYLHNW